MKITKILLSTLAIVILFGSPNNLKAHGLDIPEEVEKSGLLKAAASLDVPAVKKALAAISTITQSATDKEKNTAINESVLGLMTYYLDSAAYWLEKGDYPLPSDEWRHMTANQAYARAMEITKLLIDNTSEEILIKSLPAIAQMRGSPKTARELITYMLVDKKIKPKKEVLSSALYGAAMGENPELIALLIEHGADVNFVNFIDPVYADRKDTPLHNAQDQKTFELLIAKGANVHAKNNTGDTPLHQVSSRKKEMAKMDLLLKKGANINAKNNAGQTPLQLFIYWNLETPILDTIKFFITHGADSTITDNNGFTPLATFITGLDRAEYGYFPTTITQQEKDAIINYLKQEMSKKMSAADIEKQVSLGAKKHEEITAKETVATNERNIRDAFRAAGNDLKKLTELITTGKIDVNVKGIDRSKQGQTLLHQTVAYYYNNDYLERVQFLVQHNIDLYALDKENRTALDLAKEKLKKINKDSTNGKQLQKAIDYLTQEMAKKPAAPTPVTEKK